MFNTDSIRPWSCMPGPAPSATAKLGLMARAGIDESTIVFAGAAAGLAASTAIVLRALSQAF